MVGPLIDRAAIAQSAAKGMRNNDDAYVRAANYPDGGGSSQNVPSPSLLDGDGLPTISAYAQDGKNN